MSKRDLIILTGIMFVSFLAGIGVVPFLSIFALSYPGVESGQAGIFLAILSGALTAGSIAGGWLADRFGRRKLLIQLGGLLGFPSFLLISYTTELWQLTILACLAWFALGLSTTLVRVIAGILADKNERGRIFGIINAAIPASALVSGFLSGRIVDQWDIPTLFTILSSMFLLQFVLVSFIEDVSAKPATDEHGNRQPQIQFSAGLSYWLLVFATIANFVALAQVIMGRPLLMEQLLFSNTAISEVLVAGGLVSLPMTFLVGTLSDRFGRKRMLVLSFIISIPGIAILAFAHSLWQFWISEMLIAFIGIANVVGFAFVADLVPQESLDRAMSYYSAAGWIGTIFGYLFVGYIIGWIGLSPMFLTAAAMGFTGLLILQGISAPVITPVDHDIVPQVVEL